MKPSPGIKFELRPLRHDTLNIVTLRGLEGVHASRPLPTSGPCDASQSSLRSEARPLTQIPSGRLRGSGRRRQWAVRGLSERPQPGPRNVGRPGASRPGALPPQRKKELATLQKSWANFSGDDGCGRGEWGWGIESTPPAPRRWNLGNQAAGRPPAFRFPPPRGQDA